MAGTTTTLAVTIGRGETRHPDRRHRSATRPRSLRRSTARRSKSCPARAGLTCTIRRGVNFTFPAGHTAGATITPVAITLS